ncbi:MAG: hypothetical protein IKE30_06455, partial [Clostridia bacterium]|nr:hypothetical protein [Clostridia bacterium]
GTPGGAFCAIHFLQISRFTSSKPSKSAGTPDAKFTRRPTTSFVRYCPNGLAPGIGKGGFD